MSDLALNDLQWLLWDYNKPNRKSGTDSNAVFYFCEMFKQNHL